MYKISEVAELLAVEKTDIFAKLISHKSLLDPNIKKVDGVTYFDQRGVEILKTLLLKSNVVVEETDVETDDEEDDVFSESDDVTKPYAMSKFEKERKILLDQIEILQNELFKLDEEIALKDNLILGYQVKLDEDFETLGKFQQQMLKKISRTVE